MNHSQFWTAFWFGPDWVEFKNLLHKSKIKVSLFSPINTFPPHCNNSNASACSLPINFLSKQNFIPVARRKQISFNSRNRVEMSPISPDMTMLAFQFEIYYVTQRSTHQNRLVLEHHTAPESSNCSILGLIRTISLVPSLVASISV